MNCFLSPSKSCTLGPFNCVDARLRSSINDDKHRAKTDSPMYNYN